MVYIVPTISMKLEEFDKTARLAVPIELLLRKDVVGTPV